jgi:carbon monoxide dehydrogenase subunit G
MRLASELRVSTPLERTWRALLEVPRVARSMPGATIEPDPVDGGYRGSMKVKLGPVQTEYSGVARLQDVDEDEHIASFRVQGREAHGQGSAQATITIRAQAAGEGTRLQVETDLQISGRQAQLGQGIMEEVAAGVLREFASRLEQAIVSGGDPARSAAAEAFDAGGAVYRPLLERLAIAVAGAVAGLVLGRTIWRR